MATLNISTLSGYQYLTDFTVSINPSALGDYIIWNSDTRVQGSSSSHIFTNIGTYNIYAGTCSTLSTVVLSVYNGPFFQDAITTNYTAPSSTECGTGLYTINVSSTNPYTTINMYASGSNSIPYIKQVKYWTHLNPQWYFMDDADNIVSSISLTGAPVLSGGYTLGYVASAAVLYKDEFPGQPILWWTMDKSPDNSRIYSAITHTVSAGVPDRIHFTQDGIQPINELQWADQYIPYIISVGNENCTLMHSASGYMTSIGVYQGCNGISPAEYVKVLSSIKLQDAYGFPTGGYIRLNLSVPSSAFQPTIIEDLPVSCGTNPYETEFYNVRNNPVNIQLSASGIFNVGGIVYNLSGVSTPFNVYKLENFHNIKTHHEDTSLYDLIDRYSHFNLQEMPLANAYMSAVFGSDGLGVLYSQVQNYVADNVDIDTCNIRSIVDISKKLDDPVDTWDVEFPSTLQRAMDLLSIPLQKLIGTRCVCNTNFKDCSNCTGANICRVCKFDKRSNIGTQLSLTDRVYAGDIILIREHGSKTYEFFYVEDDAVINTLTKYPFTTKSVTDFCFYKWDQTAQNNPVESMVNYKDPNTLLSPLLTSSNDFYGRNGVLEETFNYILTKNIFGQ